MVGTCFLPSSRTNYSHEGFILSLVFTIIPCNLMIVLSLTFFFEETSLVYLRRSRLYFYASINSFMKVDSIVAVGELVSYFDLYNR